jgi:hypothetical protein
MEINYELYVTLSNNNNNNKNIEKLTDKNYSYNYFHDIIK